IEGALRQKNELLVKLYNRRAVEIEEITARLLSYAERLQPMVVDTTEMLNSALDRDEVVLMAGGQATFLDVDHGTSPVVTSSRSRAHCARRTSCWSSCTTAERSRSRRSPHGSCPTPSGCSRWWSTPPRC